MEEFRSGFEFLEQLEKQEPGKKQSFDSLKQFLSAKASKQGIPLNGIFELTPLCNYSCKMCYTHLNREQMQGKELLTVSQWKGLMYDAWKAGMLYAVLTGGECLTYPGFEELYLYLRSLGVLVSLLTNGSLLDDRRIRFFQEHKPVQMLITLYGGDEDTYERVTGQRKYAAVTDNIRKLITAGIPLKVAVTPSRYMGEGVFDAIRSAASFGIPFTVNTMLFDPKKETGRSGQAHDLSTEEYVKILRFLNKLQGRDTRETAEDLLPLPGGPCHEKKETGLPCKAGRSSFTLEWDGKMHPCSSIREIWSNPLQDGFRIAWDDLRRQCQRWIEIPECADCPYLSVCVPCPALKAQIAGQGVQPAALCERTRCLVRCGVRDLPDCEDIQR